MSKRGADKADDSTKAEDAVMTADQQTDQAQRIGLTEEDLEDRVVEAVRQRFYVTTEGEIRRMMQAEADEQARLLRTNEAPEGGKYLVPILSPSDSLLGYEWRDGNGNPVDPPSDWQE